MPGYLRARRHRQRDDHHPAAELGRPQDRLLLHLRLLAFADGHQQDPELRRRRRACRPCSARASTWAWSWGWRCWHPVLVRHAVHPLGPRDARHRRQPAGGPAQRYPARRLPRRGDVPRRRHRRPGRHGPGLRLLRRAAGQLLARHRLHGLPDQLAGGRLTAGDRGDFLRRGHHPDRRQSAAADARPALRGHQHPAGDDAVRRPGPPQLQPAGGRRHESARHPGRALERHLLGHLAALHHAGRDRRRTLRDRQPGAGRACCWSAPRPALP